MLAFASTVFAPCVCDNMIWGVRSHMLRRAHRAHTTCIHHVTLICNDKLLELIWMDCGAICILYSFVWCLRLGIQLRTGDNIVRAHQLNANKMNSLLAHNLFCNSDSDRGTRNSEALQMRPNAALVQSTLCFCRDTHSSYVFNTNKTSRHMGHPHPTRSLWVELLFYI